MESNEKFLIVLTDIFSLKLKIEFRKKIRSPKLFLKLNIFLG